MKFLKKDFFICFFLILLSGLFWLFYLKTEPIFLSNPDSAKFADVARNYKNGHGLTTTYSLCKEQIVDKRCFTFTSPPLYPYLLSFSMRLFGENDRAIIYTSGFFYILSILATYFLAKKIFNRKIALFSAVTLIFTEQFIFHSVSGASETFFTFLLIITFIFIFRKTPFSLILASITSFLLLATKIQGLIYLLSICLYVILIFLENKKLNFVLFYILPIIALYLICKIISLESITYAPYYLLGSKTFSYFLFYNSPVFPSGSLDQQTSLASSYHLIDFLKPISMKAINNFYDVLKKILTITNSFIIVLYYLNFLKREKRYIKLLKLLSLFFLLFFLTTGVIGIFNIRYVHPILPLIIIFSIAFFLAIINRFVGESLKTRFQIIYFLIFVVFYSLTQINLGARILKKERNPGKISVYQLIGENFSQFSKKSDIVGTNLEIWGSWYGKRKTILLPEKPSQIAENINTIILSTYSPGTEMSIGWQKIFNEETSFSKFKLVKAIEIKPTDNYQNIYIRLGIYQKKNE